jgi:hypothetical protein
MLIFHGAGGRPPNAPLQPRRLILAPTGDGCKRSLGGSLFEPQRLASHEEANRVLQTSGPRLLVLRSLDPPDEAPAV